MGSLSAFERSLLSVHMEKIRATAYRCGSLESQNGDSPYLLANKERSRQEMDKAQSEFFRLVKDFHGKNKKQD
jgi:hypothetical protein